MRADPAFNCSLHLTQVWMHILVIFFLPLVLFSSHDCQLLLRPHSSLHSIIDGRPHQTAFLLITFLTKTLAKAGPVLWWKHMKNPFTYTLNNATTPLKTWSTSRPTFFLWYWSYAENSPEGGWQIGVSRCVVIRYWCCYCWGSPCLDVSSHLGYMCVDNLLKTSTFWNNMLICAQKSAEVLD